MAQSNKSRIIIWTIVGILVVVAAVMLIKKPKATDKLPINTERFVRQMEGRLQKLEVRVAKARAEAPTAPAERWQQISDGIASARQVLTEMPALTEQKDLQAKASEAWKAYNGAKKTLRDITGQDASADSADGD